VKPTLVFTLLLFSYYLSTAQLRLGPFAGYGLTNCAVTEDDRPFQTSRKSGIMGGINAEYMFRSNIAVQSGILYMTEGCKIGGYVTKKDQGIFLHNIVMPMSIQYKVPTIRGQKFFIGAGLYVAGNVARQVDYYYPAGRWRSSKYPEIKPLSIGCNVHVGYELPNGIYMRLAYQQCFTDVFDIDHIIYRATCVPYQANIGMGYYFHARRSSKTVENKD
jgi:hypothetical protein